VRGINDIGIGKVVRLYEFYDFYVEKYPIEGLSSRTNEVVKGGSASGKTSK